MIYKVKSFLELHEHLLEKGLYFFASDGTKQKCGLCSIEVERKGICVQLGFHIRKMGLRPISYVDIYQMQCEGLDVSEITSDIITLSKEGLDTTYWASESLDPCCGIYTPLRQNIVLLLAALNNEL